MPAINVARTDTFEQQRIKINQIGEQIFNVTAGGSDLSTGNLKLGDGTRTNPSLAFVSDSSLGIYKSATSTIGFVSNSKKLIDYSQDAVINFKDFIVQQNIITNSGTSITSVGSNYDAGSYTDILLTGGTGDDATAEIVVTEFGGVINSRGQNYLEGSYSDIPLSGGTGGGTTVSFDVEGIVGDIVSQGSGYIPGTYTGISLSGGSGSGALAELTIEGDIIPTGIITSPGSGYTQGVYNGVQLLNTPTQTFTITTVNNPGTPPPTSVYQVNGVTQQALTLIRGNTYRFDVSDISNQGNPLIFQGQGGGTLDFNNYAVIQKGVGGQAGAFIDLIIKPTASVGSIVYNSAANDGGGANISIVTGAEGAYGTNATADITVNASGNVSDLVFTTNGDDLKSGDVLQVSNSDVGGSGSGFEFTLSTPTYTGEVTAITIEDNGQDYIINNILSVNNADVGGAGSGFSFRITSNPGIVKNLNFIDKSAGYTVGDLLQLPEEVSGLQTDLKGQVFGVSTTLSTSSPVISVASTNGIIAGMNVSADIINSVGNVDLSTTVLSVDSPTQLTLSQNPLSDGAAILNFSSPGSLVEIQLTSVNGIFVGSLVSQTSGTGQIAPNTTVSQFDADTNIVTLSTQPTTAGPATLDFAPPFGVPINKFEYEIESLGSIESYDITSGGNGYSLLDVLSVNSTDLTQPIELTVTNKELQRITFVSNVPSGVFSVGDTITLVGGSGLVIPISEIYDIKLSGGFVESMLVDSGNFVSGDTITGDSVSTSDYDIDTVVNSYRFFIDSGSGPEISPNLTFYVGNTYHFDLSDDSNDSHNFSLSTFRDGIWGPSYIQNVVTTLSDSTNQITVSSTTGILPGMEVFVTDGDGVLQLTTLVESVVPASNLIVLSKVPSSSGSATLSFRGTEYQEGVERSGNILSIKVIETTPNLYYYCAIPNDAHVDEGGEDNEEALITIDPNNPKVFGSGFALSVSDLLTQNIISADVKTGEVTAVTFTGTDATLEDATVSQLLTAPTISGNAITASSINSSGSLSLTGTSIDVSGNFNVGSNVQVANATGNITTSGTLRTNGVLNVNNFTTIVDNNISSLANSDIILTPSLGRVAKINATTAITIPAGSTQERPGTNVVQNGSIRFNTTTNQYEGYSATTTSWSSLGGVRDLDGNTYIIAEASVGANDNTLWFINDDVNTVKFTPTHLEFVNQKSIRSANVNAPSYVNWTANTPVSLGDYLKYKNNLYEVTVAGTTGTSGSEPIHTNGSVLNGSAELTWHSLAVAPLTFEDIEVLRIGPLGSLPLSINSDLRLANNVISTDINDLVIRPNSGKKVIVDSPSSLVVPSGVDADRGIPIQGSIRFSQTSSQFEGYDGINWGSLGGVKDVDQNTYIIPELSPGSNENILYFYNDNNNTLQLTTNALDFYSIDTIRSVTSDELEITASLLTFDQGTSTFDNTDITRTFLHTTKQYFDLGLSAGLTTDVVLRLDDQGDVYLNTGFGTGVYTGVKVLDGDLKEFELADIKILTEKITLVKGSSNNGSSELYAISTNAGCKTTVIAHNPTSGDKEFIEFGVLDDGVDVFHTEYGNIRTGAQLIIPTFEVTGTNIVRINIELGAAVNPTESVNITIVSNITKK